MAEKSIMKEWDDKRVSLANRYEDLRKQEQDKKAALERALQKPRSRGSEKLVNTRRRELVKITERTDKAQHALQAHIRDYDKAVKEAKRAGEIG